MKVVVTGGDGFIGSNLAEDLRYFNVCGPSQDLVSEYAPVIPRFIQRALKGMPPVIHGDDEQTRDFTYIEDVVWANILAAENEAEGVYNIGNGKNTIS